MPFVFIILGLLFLVVAIRGTQAQFFALLRSEFVGANSFVPWASAIVILGLIGYARPVRPVTDALIGLIILAMLLANRGGFFAQFNSALRNPVAPDASGSAPASGLAGTTYSPAFTPANATPASTGGTAGGGAGTSLVPIYNSNGQWIGYRDPAFTG